MFQSPFRLTRNYQAVENPEQHVYAALSSKLIFSFLSFVRWQYWESCLRSAAPDGRQGATWPTAACPRVQGGCSEKESLQLEHKSAARAPVFRCGGVQRLGGAEGRRRCDFKSNIVV